MEELLNKYPFGYGEARVKLMASRRIETHAAYLIKHLRPGMKLLDVGCGPGNLSLEFAKHLCNGSVIGCDLEPSQFKDTIKTASESNLSNLHFQAEDATTLSFEDNSFDLVHTHAVLHHLSDPLKALKEMRRVVKPRGIIAVREPNISSLMAYPEEALIHKQISIYTKFASEVLGHNYNIGLGLRDLYFKAGIFNFQTTSSCETFVDKLLQAVALTMAEDWDTSPFNKDLLKSGYATAEDAEAIIAAWLQFANNKKSLLALPYIEMIGFK